MNDLYFMMGYYFGFTKNQVNEMYLADAITYMKKLKEHQGAMLKSFENMKKGRF